MLVQNLNTQRRNEERNEVRGATRHSELCDLLPGLCPRECYRNPELRFGASFTLRLVPNWYPTNCLQVP